jgi:hypothetical protein
MTFCALLLQECNAIAVIDLETEEVSDLWPMGYKDWSDLEVRSWQKTFLSSDIQHEQHILL